MAEFRIPKGKPYEFTVRVVAKDSFLAQDLADGAGTAICTFELIDIATTEVYSTVIQGVVQGTFIAATADTSAYTSYKDGLVKFSLDSDYTKELIVSRSDKVDGYYLKPGYQGVITITFADPSIADRVTTVDKVYIVPSGSVTPLYMGLEIAKDALFTINWILPMEPTEVLTEDMFSISVIQADGLTQHIRDSEILFINFVAPTSTTTGSMQSQLTPTSYGTFEIALNQDNALDNTVYLEVARPKFNVVVGAAGQVLPTSFDYTIVWN